MLRAGSTDCLDLYDDRHGSYGSYGSHGSLRWVDGKEQGLSGGVVFLHACFEKGCLRMGGCGSPSLAVAVPPVVSRLLHLPTPFLPSCAPPACLQHARQERQGQHPRGRGAARPNQGAALSTQLASSTAQRAQHSPAHHTTAQQAARGQPMSTQCTNRRAL